MDIFQVNNIWWGLGTSFILGAVTAGSEIIPKYKDDPIKAIGNFFGVLYLFLNGAIAALVLVLIILAENDTFTAGTIIDMLKYAALAGLGSMVVLRSKLSDVKLSSGETVPIGPDFIIQTYLNLLDRNIDRKRAIARIDVIRKYMQNIDYEQSKLKLGNLLQTSMQNLSSEEESWLGNEISEIDKLEIEPRDKSYLLGFHLLDLGGEKLLGKLAEECKEGVT